MKAPRPLKLAHLKTNEVVLASCAGTQYSKVHAIIFKNRFDSEAEPVISIEDGTTRVELPSELFDVRNDFMMLENIELYGDVAIKAKLNPSKGGIAVTNGLGVLGSFGVDTNADGIADGFTGSNLASKSIADGVQNFLVNAQYGQISTPFDVVAGRKYYFAAVINSACGADNVRFKVGQTGAASTEFITGDGSDELVGVVHEAVATETANVYIIDDQTVGWSQISTKEWIAVDLETVFGKGNEPDVDWCKANIDYIENTQTLVIGVDVAVFGTPPEDIPESDR